MKLYDVESVSENFYWFMCSECDQNPKFNTAKKAALVLISDLRNQDYTKRLYCAWCCEEIPDSERIVRFAQTGLPQSWFSKNFNRWTGSQADHAYGIFVDFSPSEISIET